MSKSPSGNGVRIQEAVGEAGKAIAVRLLPGTDLINGLVDACERHGVRSGAVIACIGSLSTATIDYEGHEPVVLQGTITIFSAQGIISTDPTGKIAIHFHASFGDERGNLYGGQFGPGGCPVLNTLEAVILELRGARLLRDRDPETGFIVTLPQPST
jgi:predicted DNA-binding protein with PD1-like motif